ncbi:MAG: transcription termination factor Rho, partial [Lachnospiraceae bacterium]|nr:transcription termination factor Rho [Lachnospiraceae bacterium]
SRMDDVVYEELKGTGNIELVLDRKLSEKRIFPAIDIPKSSTRREDLLLTPEEQQAMNKLRNAFCGNKPDESVNQVLRMIKDTRNNQEFIMRVAKYHFDY